ncbi:EamA family transporter [Fibrella sp. HMF5335]|uniref:EamA family transporter n=1 Tax=Fibrella rubiginis TaxID=2817060 RepID=A0A939GHV6_9BACT|nr:DMT family transporter [Fibrella rubiginis]MBO0938083.1 EamA family transporter [Fibrella rubiginis]
MLSALFSLPFVAVGVRIIANPLANVFQKQLTHRSAVPLFVTCATYGFLTLACLTVLNHFALTDLSAVFWQNMLVCSVLGVLGNVFLVKATHLGDLSVLGPINAYKAVVSLLAGIVVLGELPSWLGLTGVGLIVAGSYIVLSKGGGSTWSWAIVNQPEVRLRLMALLCSGIDGVFLKRAIQLSSPGTAFFFWCWLGFVMSLVWFVTTQWRTSPAQATILARKWPTYLALFVCIGLMQVSTNIAFSRMQVGYALALFQTSALLSVLFGYRFFNETGLIRKLTGAVIMVTGAVLIILFK